MLEPPSPQQTSLRRRLPPGVKDLVGAPARRLVRLSAVLHGLFERWGYNPVLPPIFEYYDNIVAGYGDDHVADLYRFVDPEGQLLALRPDLTISIARIAATKLGGGVVPVRLGYVAPVFRYVEPQAGRQREFWQAGVELIGADSADADAEVIALLVAALGDALELPEFQVNLGHMGYVRALLAEAQLSDQQRDVLRRAIDRKNSPVLDRELATVSLPGNVREALTALPNLWGGAETLAQAARLTPTDGAAAAIRRLTDVYERLQAYGVGHRITVDLGEVRGMDYYTGVTFEVFAPGSGYAIASGGRYDDLLTRFGSDWPAVGYAIQLERAMLILDRDALDAPSLVSEVLA
ncbi:MAG TPA: ATP phosphoribosyltransferase regulatory subunit, partial [Ardenticatenaceae bacterium]|nr:ATP phosphoribosyltransferase regulatory subunit [Ardenticatenaceae bacterium]